MLGIKALEAQVADLDAKVSTIEEIEIRDCMQSAKDDVELTRKHLKLYWPTI